MPTYEYKCQKCQRQFDVFQRMTDAPLTECSDCHGPLKRLIGAGAGFIFKGSGFYITDYRSDSYKQAERRASSDTGSSSSSTSSSSTAKSSTAETKKP
ncbi:MAG: hypothetical protein GX595_11460 [Lentisphaerae bacterium]|nr:hypothetical protein [Lentisphaerota bacterium]